MAKSCTTNHKSNSGERFIGSAEDGSMIVGSIEKSIKESSASTVHGLPLFSTTKDKN